MGTSNAFDMLILPVLECLVGAFAVMIVLQFVKVATRRLLGLVHRPNAETSPSGPVSNHSTYREPHRGRRFAGRVVHYFR